MTAERRNEISMLRLVDRGANGWVYNLPSHETIIWSQVTSIHYVVALFVLKICSRSHKHMCFDSLNFWVLAFGLANFELIILLAKGEQTDLGAFNDDWPKQ